MHVERNHEEGIQTEHAKAYIEDRIRQSVIAINERDFSPSHPAWQAYTSVFSCGSISRYQENNPIPLNNQTHNVSVTAMLDIVRHFTEANPDYRCRLMDVLTFVDEKNRFAECFVTMEDSGVPRKGIVKQTVSKTAWRWLDGEWRCVDYRSIEGLDGLAGLEV